MYLHIGNEILVKSKNIIGIFNLDTIANETKKDLYLNKRYYEMIDMSDKNSKSLIIVQKDKKNYIYFSNLSGETLKNRITVDKNKYKK